MTLKPKQRQGKPRRLLSPGKPEMWVPEMTCGRRYTAFWMGGNTVMFIEQWTEDQIRHICKRVLNKEDIDPDEIATLALGVLRCLDGQSIRAALWLKGAGRPATDDVRDFNVTAHYLLQQRRNEKQAVAEMLTAQAFATSVANVHRIVLMTKPTLEQWLSRFNSGEDMLEALARPGAQLVFVTFPREDQSTGYLLSVVPPNQDFRDFELPDGEQIFEIGIMAGTSKDEDSFARYVRPGAAAPRRS